MLTIYTYPLPHWENYIALDIYEYATEVLRIPVEIKHKSLFAPFGKEDDIDIALQVKRTLVTQLNKDIYFINHDDSHKISRFRNVLADPNLKAIIRCQYRDGFYNKLKIPVYPFTYLERNPILMRSVQQDFRKQYKPFKDKLYWRGIYWKYNRIHLLEGLKDILSVAFDEKVPFEEYIKEMSEHKLALSFPGGGNFCQREIECFGLGVPILMPKLKNKFYNNLIPDIHYISVDVNFEDGCFEEHCNKIKERYFEVINDIEYLQLVAKNAQTWYDANVQYPAIPKLYFKHIGL